MTPLEASTHLLLHLDETDGAFQDSSPRRSKLSISGTPGTSTSSKFGAACFSNASATPAAQISTQLGVDTRVPMFCDFWINLTAYNTDNGCRILYEASLIDIAVQTAAAGGRLTFTVYDGGNNGITLTAAGAVGTGGFVHCLVGIDENLTRRVFYNGVSQGFASSAISHRTNAIFGQVGLFGSRTPPNCGINGLVDEFRYVYGYPCPSADFTPPASPYADTDPAGAKVADTANRLLGTPPAATNFKLAQQPLFLRDRTDSGFGQIVGTVTEKSTPTNVPLSRKVRLFHELSGRFIRETWSDDAGNYAFTGIDPTQRYTVVSYDYLQNYCAVIADNILPEVA